MAPEIFNHLPYTEKVDIWSLGILLYELLHSHSPFRGKTPVDILQNIYRQKIRYGEQTCSLAKDLIGRILTINPSQRPSIDEII